MMPVITPQNVSIVFALALETERRTEEEQRALLEVAQVLDEEALCPCCRLEQDPKEIGPRVRAAVSTWAENDSDDIFDTTEDLEEKSVSYLGEIVSDDTKRREAMS